MRKLSHNILVGCVLLLGISACASKSGQQQQQQTVVPEAPEDSKAGTKQKPASQKEAQPAKPAAEEKTAKPAPDAYTLAKSAALTAAKLKRQMRVAEPLRISRVPMEGKYVALTFDDGPSTQYTSKVLDILKKYDAKGTFFVLGSRLGSGAEILKRTDAEGHEIGAHTWSHINMRASSSETVASEMDRTNRRIFNIIGKYPKVMRPPYGATSTELVNRMFDQFGQRSIMWDVDTRDWTKPGVATVTSRAVQGARPGSIILVHDIHGSTLAALEGIVKGLQQRGFKLVTVSELMSLRGCKPEGATKEEQPAAETGSVSQEQPQPAVQTQPQPVNQTQPQPVNQTQPQPAVQAQPQPAQQAQPQPEPQALPEKSEEVVPPPAPAAA